MKRGSLILLIALLFTAEACIDEKECIYDTSHNIKFDFINSEMLYADTLQLDTIIVEHAIDTVFYGTGVDVISLELPLNPNGTETNYFFDLLDPEVDFNITMGYEIMPRVLSEECGVEQEIRNLFVVSHDVDSVIIVNDVLNDQVETNVKVYQ